ncbi:MAG: hypothetical protein HRU35_05655 [Rickettsiaceae bacterium]|nr:hypothetical protein [Rickettsiaceae bacterium]
MKDKKLRKKLLGKDISKFKNFYDTLKPIEQGDFLNRLQDQFVQKFKEGLDPTDDDLFMEMDEYNIGLGKNMEQQMFNKSNEREEFEDLKYYLEEGDYISNSSKDEAKEMLIETLVLKENYETFRTAVEKDLLDNPQQAIKNKNNKKDVDNKQQENKKEENKPKLFEPKKTPLDKLKEYYDEINIDDDIEEELDQLEKEEKEKLKDRNEEYEKWVSKGSDKGIITKNSEGKKEGKLEWLLGVEEKYEQDKNKLEAKKSKDIPNNEYKFFGKLLTGSVGQVVLANRLLAQNNETAETALEELKNDNSKWKEAAKENLNTFLKGLKEDIKEGKKEDIKSLNKNHLKLIVSEFEKNIDSYIDTVSASLIERLEDLKQKNPEEFKEMEPNMLILKQASEIDIAKSANQLSKQEESRIELNLLTGKDSQIMDDDNILTNKEQKTRKMWKVLSYACKECKLGKLSNFCEKQYEGIYKKKLLKKLVRENLDQKSIKEFIAGGKLKSPSSYRRSASHTVNSQKGKGRG